MVRKPDFIVVGAPKCGTTSLYSYLKRNPSVFLPPKELHYFGSDLRFAQHRMTQDEYEAHFAPAGDRATGDVSVWYLYSSTAAHEIRSYCPDCKIIIMLRNPVDLMYSMHSQALYTQDEDEPSFERALQLEPFRRNGGSLPRIPNVGHAVFYREIARLSGQIVRFSDLFPPEQIHFILLDDLAARPETEWLRLCSYLGVDASDVSSFPVANAYKINRFSALATAATYVPRAVVPKLGLRRLPRPVKDSLIGAYRSLQRWNTAHPKRPPMPPGLRSALVEEFADEIEALERILDRDLSGWRA